MAKVIDAQRSPFEKQLNEVIGQTSDDQTLYRRGNFNGTWDDLICNALIEEREADIALSPGVRWGPSILPGQDITREDIWNVTAMSYGEAYKTEMTGEFLHIILEDVADNLFNPDPYYQQGGDMVRVGGLGYRIDINKPQGQRITEMTLLKPATKLILSGLIMWPVGPVLMKGLRGLKFGMWSRITFVNKAPSLWIQTTVSRLLEPKTLHIIEGN